MKSTLVFCIIIGLGWSTLTNAAESDVLELNDDNFVSTLAQHETTLVMFYAPWCGHCKRLKPEYAKAAELVKDDDPPISLAKVDCTEGGKETCNKFSVSGYPTLKIFKGDEVSQDYNGPREAAGIAKFMRAQVGPASKDIGSVADFDKFLSVKETTLFGYFKDMDSKLAKTFLKFADKNREKYRFGHSSNADVLEKAGESDSIVLVRAPHLSNKFEDSSVKFDGTSESDLTTFVKDNFHGLVGHRTQETVRDFKNPLITAYYSVDYVKNAKGTNYWRNRVLKVAKEFAGKLNFAISAKDDFQHELNEYGYDFVGEKPVILARDAKNLKYALKEEFSVENLRDFAEKLLEGELEPYIKSEPVPEDNSAPVKVAVAKNFEEEVMNNGKDTLIEFYAPWCGHCKKLTPIYDELAEKLQDEDVVIAKMDATANDVPPEFNVRGFPTLFWLPKDSKTKPVPYNEGREVDDFIKFISKHATNELNGYDRSGKPKKTEL
ncbi:protein disulfide-isomerase A3 [Stomoxys calcitrans]|uniref:Protein disulfide-isomerase n=1 Tax=Stomoxys calcitrans TaxID=35570 RepID=A0A1I8NRA8_STOCA|nr:protein disulfide-isomerase A3 [Stomoxys calcitrans]